MVEVRRVFFNVVDGQAEFGTEEGRTEFGDEFFARVDGGGAWADEGVAGEACRVTGPMRAFVEARAEVLRVGDEAVARGEVDGVGGGVVAGACTAVGEEGGDAVERWVEARGEAGVRRRGRWREEVRGETVDLVGGENGERTQDNAARGRVGVRGRSGGTGRGGGRRGGRGRSGCEVFVEEDVCRAFAAADLAAEGVRLFEGQPVAGGELVFRRRRPQRDDVEAFVRDAVVTKREGEGGGAVPGLDPGTNAVVERGEELGRDARRESNRAAGARGVCVCGGRRVW